MGPTIQKEHVQAVSSPEGVLQFFARLDYNVSEPADQTAASLGLAERVHHMVRQVRRITMLAMGPGLPAGLEIYWIEATHLTADLRKAAANAFRNKPANTFLLLTTREFSSLEFVLIEKASAKAGSLSGPSVSHRLLLVDRGNPSDVHVRVLERMRNKGADPYAQYDRIKDAFKVAEWSENDFNNRNLFSDYFLKHRLTIKDLFPDWQKDVRPQLREFKETWQQAGSISNLGAADYHSKFIKPLLESLGFSLSADGKNDGSADYVLRSSGSDKGTQPIAALLVYPWDRPLDRKDDSERERAEDIPGIRVVKVLEAQKFNWAILTNGKDWRLYCSQAHSRASNYYEIDLPGMLDQDDLTAFRYFYFFFRAEAFNLQRSATGTPEAEPLCFLDRLRQGSAEFAKEVGDRLRKQIFESVFPYLAQGFVDYRKSKYGEATKAGDAFLNEVYDATLTLLYRLLFLLYAESLDLVPVNEPAYAASSLRSLKKEIGDAASGDSEVVEDRLKRRYDKSETKLYKRLGQLFDVIDGSDNELSRKFNVPAYNGGLFRTQPPASDKSREAAAARFLNKYRVPDYYLARALDLLARDEDTKSHKLVFVDYKALGVRELGSIYEGLLMYHVVIPADEWEKGYQRRGLKVALVPSNKERKKLGSYFTPQHIVKYIVANTVGPLLAEKFDAIAPKLREAQRSYRETREFEIRRAEKMRGTPRSNDAIASGILEEFENVVWDLFDLKVLDPAMGSGHFLVETVDFISDKVLDFLAGFPWNPVHVLIEQRIRRQILESLDAQGVKINEDRLTDVNLIKRLVMKRCAYGVDLNPMAVELAKVSLWLDSFTLGAPLSFLDHHLKCGNSLIGSSIAELRRIVADSRSLFAIPMEPLERATRNMEVIADLTDSTIDEVTKSAETYAHVQSGVRAYRALLDCLTSERFGVGEARDVVVHAEALGLKIEDWDRSLNDAKHDRAANKLARVIGEAQSISCSRQFLHWDLDFPDVFFSAKRALNKRGFDAVIGNPPYDELSEYEAESELPEKGYLESSPLYAAARGGRQNLFRFFVVRALSLSTPGGLQSFIVPMALLTDEFTGNLRSWMRRNHFPKLIDAFPQKDDSSRRIFEEAKLSTCVYVAASGRSGGSCIVRTHRWNHIEPESPYYELHQDMYDQGETLSAIPIGIDEVELGLLRRFGAGVGRFEDQAKFFPGELMLNSGFKFLAKSSTPSEQTPEILRGAHVMRWYKSSRARQGESQFLDKIKFLKQVRGEKSGHHKLRRFVYQRYAAIDNYRRLIGSIVEAQNYCSHTTGYMVPKEYSLEACACLFNSAVLEWRFGLTSSNNNINSYELEALPIPQIQSPSQDQSRSPQVTSEDDFLRASKIMAMERPGESIWPESAHDALTSLGKLQTQLGAHFDVLPRQLEIAVQDAIGVSDSGLMGVQRLREVDYLGWNARFASGRPSSQDGRTFFNGVAPPIPGNGPGDIPHDLIARVYPSYPLPGIDVSAWEAAAWEEFCDLLRKNKNKIGHARIRADLTGRGVITHPTGPMRKLQEMFLKYHRDIRENRAKAAEIDFLIDRIVFKLFDLTLDEQKLILSRVGPSRPLPPRRGKRRKLKSPAESGPDLFTP